LFGQPALASACGQCEWSVVEGDHGAGDRNLLAGRHDHDLVGADVTDVDLDLDALGPLVRPGIIDRDLVKQMCALFAAPTVSVVVRILLWSLDVGRGGTGW
jgi:hypothetical protein